MARRKGKVIQPISGPSDKPNINELLAKEEASNPGATIAPPPNPPVDTPVPEQAPPPQPQPPAEPAPDMSNTGAETVAEERDEINKQIQDFVDHQTEAVESGEDNADQPAQENAAQ